MEDDDPDFYYDHSFSPGRYNVMLTCSDCKGTNLYSIGQERPLDTIPCSFCNHRRVLEQFVRKTTN